MFNNIPEKIKLWAKIEAFGGIIFGVLIMVLGLLCILLGVGDLDLDIVPQGGLLIIYGLLMGLLSVVSSWFTYGLGELLENIESINNKITFMVRKKKDNSDIEIF